ncbi:hypothetical protein NDI54_03465 [Haloarcula sp. S1AR25-5A]|uniref:Uncharacterized protein n=1 Tax=Haloarcula terrestris TaxID=2950533 RepID=A0AAE4EUJ9_9EURY|nr:hypothetical protein [Haloarcula terrestris]MDS0220406.1 hypothetical protein [Haloarcula terrestris]
MTDGGVAVGDHVRPTESDNRDSPAPDGVYRVVGTSEDVVTLLLVGTTTGRRVNTGAVVTVSREDLDSFEPAENPDGNRSVSSMLLSFLDSFWWTVWVFGQTTVARPLPAAVALALVALGIFGDGLLSLPPFGATLLFLAGFFFLVYLSRTASSR